MKHDQAIMKMCVCYDDEKQAHFLRVHLDAGAAGVLRFESEKNLSKYEADYRAVILASSCGFDRDELPTQALVSSYPKAKETP